MSTVLAGLFLSLFLLRDIPLHASTNDIGLSAKLIHRDSAESPFHEPNSTVFSRNLAAILRSASHKTLRHANFFDPNFDHMSSIVTGLKFQYIMLIEIGTPSRFIYGMIDTGSDLVWILCSPCHTCYKNTGPIFNPKGSSSYGFHPCPSNECSMLQHNPCHRRPSLCKYTYEYADNSAVEGILSTETLSFDIAPDSGGGRFQVPGIVFGCTHRTSGLFSNHATGIVGLGADGLSLVRQLGPHGGNKFSYCLPSTENRAATRIYFGSAAVVSGLNAVSTPLYITDPPESFYMIKLERIQVTSRTRTTIIIPRSQTTLRENLMHIDSGTAITFIKPGMMSDLSSTLETYVPNQRVDVPRNLARHVDLCFHSKATKDMPLIKFHFQGGAVVALKTSNIFMLVNPKTLCLAIVSNDKFGGDSVFGSRAQSTTRIEFDINTRRLTFLPDEC